MVKAMKERNQDVVSILRVVAGEFGREMKSSKELSDEAAIAVIKKMVENAKSLGNDGEVEILEKYLPQMLGENQIKIIIAGIINKHGFSGMKNMGEVMKILKSLPNATQIDGKFASSVVKEFLTK